MAEYNRRFGYRFTVEMTVACDGSQRDPRTEEVVALGLRESVESASRMLSLAGVRFENVRAEVQYLGERNADAKNG